MRRALELAERGAGAVSPNPMVGAVLLDAGGAVIGEGWHGRYGGPHAEVEAIRAAEAASAGARIDGGTMYVTLEPCSHHGKTPPCADLLVEKGIQRVVAAMGDPNPRVSGAGFARLRDAGVDVTIGLCEREAKRLNEAFVHHLATGRPLVVLKLAVTLDGRVATGSGDSRWVTGPVARALVHHWRAESDAVMVGAGTAMADDPLLTARDLPEGHQAVRQPLRVVLDRAGALPASLNLFSRADAPTVAFVCEGSRPEYADALAGSGGQVIAIPTRDGHLDVVAVLETLGGGITLPDGLRRVQTVLVEAGPGLATALLQADLVDRLYAFVAPRLVGADGLPAVGPMHIDSMSDAPAPAESTWEIVGSDALMRGYFRSL